MSKEKEPIRSRRELREQSVNATGATEQPSVPVRPAPSTPPGSAPAPRADTGSESPAPRERQSQTRARDRAALRAYKELLDPPGLSPLPSRRTLRQAQLDAERAPVTAVNPVIQVPGKLAKPAAGAQAAPVAPAPVAPGTAPPATAQAPTTAPKSAAVDAKKAQEPAQAAAAPSTAPKSAKPAPKPVHEPAAAPKEGAEPTAAPKQAPAGGSSTRGGRRAAATDPALMNQEAVQDDAATSAAAHTDQVQPGAAAAGDAAAALDAAAAEAEPSTDLPGVAAAANRFPPLPGLVPGGSYYPVSAGPPPVTTPSTEELAVLAAQKAEDERTAVLALRAQARERLAQESAKSRRPAADPTATNNLAMVTPLEFIEVPGAGRPVLRPPTTTHVPIVTRSTPRQAPASKNRAGQQRPAPAAGTPETAPGAQVPGKAPASVPNVSAERFDAALAARAVHKPGPGNRPLTGGRSSTLKWAEAMATGGHPTVGAGVEQAAVEQVEVTRSQMPPMPADYAHGLEPLDAMTAGLGRTQRNRLIHWGSIIAGGALFVVGAIMIITTLTH